jgi:hypothetical protein
MPGHVPLSKVVCKKADTGVGVFAVKSLDIRKIHVPGVLSW